MLSEVKITVCEELSVGRVIIFLLEIHKLLILKVSDVLWLTSGIELVLTLLEQVFIDSMHESIIWVAHSSLHLVVNNALVHQATVRVLGILELEPMTFLSKVVIVQIGRECHV